MDSFNQIALGVLKKKDKTVLICQRRQADSLGGLWELPGGKKECGERLLETLKREILEELGVIVSSARPLISTSISFDGARLNLNVFEVFKWTGNPVGREGQKIIWIPEDRLSDFTFPKFNNPLNTAIKLPPLACVTPPLIEGVGAYIDEIVRIVESGVRLIQLRPCAPNDGVVEKIGRLLRGRTNPKEVRVMLNGSVSQYDESLFRGLHLNRTEASKYRDRPIPKSNILSTSCHNFQELEHAVRLDVDFLYISPIKRTSSHSERMPLGWNELNKLVKRSPVPVYALGGLSAEDIISARSIGCQGIALLSSLWNRRDQKEYVQSIDRFLIDTKSN